VGNVSIGVGRRRVDVRRGRVNVTDEVKEPMNVNSSNTTARNLYDNHDA
jgi:hypothetical protein